MAFPHQLIDRTSTLPHVPSVSHRLDAFNHSMILRAPKEQWGSWSQMRPLCPDSTLNLQDTVLGNEVEKSGLIALPG